jgi:hypothetical protein
MRHDPIELNVLNSNASRRAAPVRRDTADLVLALRRKGTLPPDAIDEAFAAMPVPASTARLDGPNAVILRPQKNHPSRGELPRSNDDRVLSRLAAQVASLDRQCSQLIHLLHTLDDSSAGE